VADWSGFNLLIHDIGFAGSLPEGYAPAEHMLRRVLRQLSKEERFVIEFHYGVWTGLAYARTLEQLSDLTGFSVDELESLRQSALVHFRQPNLRSEFQEFLTNPPIPEHEIAEWKEVRGTSEL